MNDKGIISIKTGHIYPHPDNPRKDLGDLSELIESIKKNGIMQNLTVIPHEVNPGEYIAIIGHRRHAAALQAGIEEVPCRIIEGMTVKEQVSMMLEENMQRNDLTIYEQAQGFQMMMDLGETEVSIAEKTGFSRTTIRHRLNIAKLNQKELQKKEKDDNFQLTMKDLIALEKVEDIKIRNKILKEASNSRELVWKAQNAFDQARRDKNSKKVIAILEKMGVQPAPKSAANEQWSGKWDTVKDISIDKDVPDEISLKNKGKDTLYYFLYYRDIRVIKKAEKKAKELSEYEIQRKQVEKKKNQIKAKAKEMAAVRKEFIQNIISGKIEPIKEMSEVEKLLWNILICRESYICTRKMAECFMDKEYYKASQEERESAEKKIDGLSVYQQMLIMMPEAMSDLELVTYNGNYNTKSGEALKSLYEVLKLYGFSFDADDEEMLVSGTHELYVKEKGDN